MNNQAINFCLLNARQRLRSQLTQTQLGTVTGNSMY